MSSTVPDGWPSGARPFLAIVATLPGGAPVARLLQLSAPARLALDLIYRVLNRRRGILADAFGLDGPVAARARRFRSADPEIEPTRSWPRRPSTLSTPRLSPEGGPLQGSPGFGGREPAPTGRGAPPTACAVRYSPSTRTATAATAGARQPGGAGRPSSAGRATASPTRRRAQARPRPARLPSRARRRPRARRRRPPDRRRRSRRGSAARSSTGRDRPTARARTRLRQLSDLAGARGRHVAVHAQAMAMQCRVGGWRGSIDRGPTAASACGDHRPVQDMSSACACRRPYSRASSACSWRVVVRSPWRAGPRRIRRSPAPGQPASRTPENASQRVTWVASSHAPIATTITPDTAIRIG